MASIDRVRSGPSLSPGPCPVRIPAKAVRSGALDDAIPGSGHPRRLLDRPDHPAGTRPLADRVELGRKPSQLPDHLLELARPAGGARHHPLPPFHQQSQRTTRLALGRRRSNSDPGHDAFLHLLAGSDSGRCDRFADLHGPRSPSGTPEWLAGHGAAGRGRSDLLPTKPTSSQSIHPTSAAATSQGHDLAMVLGLCVAGALWLRWLLLALDRHLGKLRLPQSARLPVLGALAAAVVVAGVVLFVALDAPSYTSRQYDRFLHGSSKIGNAGDLRTRLSDPGNNGRLDQWRVAIDDGFDSVEVGWPGRRDV